MYIDTHTTAILLRNSPRSFLEWFWSNLRLPFPPKFWGCGAGAGGCFPPPRKCKLGKMGATAGGGTAPLEILGRPWGPRVDIENSILELVAVMVLAAEGGEGSPASRTMKISSLDGGRGSDPQDCRPYQNNLRALLN